MNENEYKRFPKTFNKMGYVLNNTQDAEDNYHDSLVIAYSNNYDGNRNFVAEIYRKERSRLIRDNKIKNKNDPQYAELVVGTMTECDADVRLDIAKSYTELYDLAERLVGTNYRDLFFECYVYRTEAAVIAKRLNKSRQYVVNLTNRIRKKLLLNGRAKAFMEVLL